MAALFLRRDLCHQLARTRRLIVDLDVGILLLKPFDDAADQRLLHRRVDDQLVLSVARSILLRTATASRCEQGAQHRRQDGENTPFFHTFTSLNKQPLHAFSFPHERTRTS